jgi:hypothetical protein
MPLYKGIVEKGYTKAPAGKQALRTVFNKLIF